MTISDYLDNISKRFKTGLSTEHTFRGDLQNLLESLLQDVLVTNEPTRIKCGAPDYILTKKEIPVGYIEAKDLGADLNNKNYIEQFSRYKEALENLIITNYLDFQVYKNGQLITTYSIAEIQGNNIITKTDQFEAFKAFIIDFASFGGQIIKSSQKLAVMMANKAKMLALVIESALISDEEIQENSSLKEQMYAFKDILIHDIKPKEFADLYAQTIAYGMFAARLHDPTLPTFSRQEAAELIPKTNPFLRKLFQYIAGFDLDNRIKWIVDALADIFRATDVSALLKNFGKSTQANDPIIHFYETFLSEYDPKLRKARGVWYTPEPVVKFIVRAVDDILKTEFDLKDGLADTSKTKIKIKYQTNDKRFVTDKNKGLREIEQEVHKVQILDPATGTGTFLAEVVKYIYTNKFEGQQGIWSNYVEEHLIPRLNGFELLMASYAMAHLKLDMLLTETGFKAKKDQRFRIYLTNSLEEHHPDTGTLFANWLSAEANEANQIKRDTPVMVILGNPPYSGESANKGNWIMNLMEDYKKEPGGKEKLKEKTSKWINDDYVKFLRYGQHFIEKNGSGVLAFINPHGFLDNPTFRGMRWNLLKTYDKIYTIDLHGNSKKKETCPDGSPDINVFDIMQGVAITVFVKTGKKDNNTLGEVFHFDLFGKREFKYEFLNKNKISTIDFNKINNKEPMFVMVQRNLEKEEEYKKGFSLSDLFIVNGNGITTAHDSFVIKDSKHELLQWFNDFKNSERNETFLHSKFNVKKKKGWNIIEGYDNIKSVDNLNVYARKLKYRPFDDKYIFYEDKLVWRTVRKIMNNYNKSNLGLLCPKAFKDASFSHVFVTDKISEAIFLSSQTGSNAMNLPLYIYPETNSQQSIEKTSERLPNLNSEITKLLADKIGLTFTNEKESTKNTFAPIDILDYIYAILHSPAYREKYKEFLKTDFPRITYPKNVDTFWQLVKFGSELRQIHLLESNVVDKPITKYPVDGDNLVDKPKYTDGKVYINDKQYFSDVPEVAWEFYIGGYQPAQKWLKDRKDRKLTFEDILHYQKIIVALTETDRLMKEIDKIKFD